MMNPWVTSRTGRHAIIVAGLCAAVLRPSGLPAQQLAVSPPSDLKRLSVAELLQVQVVSVARTPSPLGRAPSSLFMIDGDAVRDTGAATLPELLRLAPNLFVAQASASDWAVGARGFTRSNGRVDKMLVQIDGRTVYSPLFSGVFWDTQHVFMPDLDRVEVISGPAGVTWGANAVNGVINVTSRSARETLGGVAYAGFGTAMNADMGARYGWRVGQGSYFRVYAKRKNFDDTLAADGETSGLDGWHFTQGGFRIDGGNDPSTLEWTVQGDGYAGRYRHPDGLGLRNEGANLLARWTAHLANDAEAQLRIYHDYTLRDRPGAFTEHLRTTDVELQHRLAESRGHQILWGANYRVLNEHIANLSEDFAIRPEDQLLHLGGIFVQDIIELLPDQVRLTAGIRLEDNGYTGLEVQPSVRLAWTFQPDHTLWSAISRATRTPARVDNDFFAPADPPHTIFGGPDSRSEVVQAYELGWRGQLGPGLTASITAYYHDYSHLRSLEPGPPATVANGLNGRSYGAEFFLDWEMQEGWRWQLGYSALRQSTTFRPGGADLEGGLGAASDPRNQLFVRSSIDVAPDVSMWLGLRSIGSVPTFSGGTDAGVVPSYTELDANLRWEIRPGIEWSITGRNLLHPSHSEIGTAAARHEIKRSVFTMIRCEF